MGRVFGLLKRYDEATAVLNKGLEQWPQFVDLKELLGLNLALSGQHEAAIPYLEAIIQAHVHHPYRVLPCIRN